MLNLVLNARDAMPDGGHLLIETRNSTFLTCAECAQCVRPGRCLLVNTWACSSPTRALGMPPDVIARAFDPFFTTKPTGEGTGLGLSMLYGFVRQSGGHVLLSSEQGEGTMVSIYLPRISRRGGRRRGNRSRDHAAARGGGRGYLVGRGRGCCADGCGRALSDLGYTVLEADNSRSGLRIIETRARIDLLLTDVGLPGGMNGRQLADAAREQRPGLKVLFLPATPRAQPSATASWSRAWKS